MIVRLVAAFAALLIIAGGALPASAYTPHVLRFNYDEDDLTTLNPFLATGAPIAPLTELTGAQFVRFTFVRRGDPGARDGDPDQSERRHQRRWPHDHLALAPRGEMERRRAVQLGRRRLHLSRCHEPRQQHRQPHAVDAPCGRECTGSLYGCLPF